MGVPDIKSVALMVHPKTEEDQSKSKFNVNTGPDGTDFKEFRKYVSLLGLVLTDMWLYIKAPNAGTNMEKLIRAIGYVSSGIGEPRDLFSCTVGSLISWSSK